jgi:hypothetical protein
VIELVHLEKEYENATPLKEVSTEIGLQQGKHGGVGI